MSKMLMASQVRSTSTWVLTAALTLFTGQGVLAVISVFVGARGRGLPQDVQTAAPADVWRDVHALVRGWAGVMPYLSSSLLMYATAQLPSAGDSALRWQFCNNTNPAPKHCALITAGWFDAHVHMHARGPLEHHMCAHVHRCMAPCACCWACTRGGCAHTRLRACTCHTLCNMHADPT